ncbi:uncharacterized protein LDX57_008813 [Aspergillus melleus]|uniref:uncharacterized protein n=1 Tax=Aspergillus melleus TaxID=138277 RepID=UPI001E8DB8DE|nr:uncharacterized protein LDX57_008813 [Aspergillus melleus]KAH8431154.1 hypothetical protein LDX57_008813 [Aspergillus melleus]
MRRLKDTGLSGLLIGSRSRSDPVTGGAAPFFNRFGGTLKVGVDGRERRLPEFGSSSPAPPS